MTSYIFFNSCSILNNGKKTTVTKTENTIQRTPSGTIETDKISTTETNVTKNKTSESNNNATSINIYSDTVKHSELDFNVVKTARTKSDNHTISDSVYTTDTKNLTSLDQKIIDPTNCEATTVHLTATSSTYMNADYEAQGQHIFPGAIYYYEDFIAGKYQLVNLPRNPIILTTDLENMIGSTHTLVDKPEVTYEIRDGLASLFSRFDNRQIGLKDLRYQTYSSDNLADFSMKISAGASYGAFSAESTFSNSDKKEDHTITIDAIKDLYTISSELEKPYKNYLQNIANIDKSKHLIIISSVTYGVRILANFHLKTETTAESEIFQLKYKGLTSSAHVDFNYLSNNTNTDQTINCYVVGGPGNASVAFDRTQLEDGIKKIADGTTYSNARPISFEIQDLNGKIIETKSETDDITIQNCAIDENDYVDNVIVKISTGQENKNNKSHYHLYLHPGIDPKLIGDYNSIYLVNEGEKNDEYPNNTDKTIGMDLPENNFTFTDFQRGGSIYFRFWADNNHDTWDISSITFTIIFHSGIVKPVTFTNFYVSDDEWERRFFFDKDFNAIQ